MKDVDLSKFGLIISSKSIGEDIYQHIHNELKKNETLTVHLDKIQSMATFCAKQIFGRLYIDLGSESFFERIRLKGADEDLKRIIQIGIQHALDEK